LVLALNEQGVTHASVSFSGHVKMVNVMVWEGKLKEENILYHAYCYYEGRLYRKKKMQEMIRSLEELRDEI
jgi:hypothetical protein